MFLTNDICHCCSVGPGHTCSPITLPDKYWTYGADYWQNFIMTVTDLYIFFPHRLLNTDPTIAAIPSHSNKQIEAVTTIFY
jgi:hypothetical protein